MAVYTVNLFFLLLFFHIFYVFHILSELVFFVYLYFEVFFLKKEKKNKFKSLFFFVFYINSAYMFTKHYIKERKLTEI